MFTSKRLTQVFQLAPQIPFDNSSKFIFFSDCHRGNKSRKDNFAHNEMVFLHALNYYYLNNYTYIEIGDGDELWENKDFSIIREIYSDVFKLLHKFYLKNRLYMIYGNHDIIKKNKIKNIKTYEGVVLKHSKTNNKIFVIHGHQGDLFNDQLWKFNCFKVRYLWHFLELYAGYKDWTRPAKNYKVKRFNEKQIIKWITKNRQMIIAGHSHLPSFPTTEKPPYFNDGCCIHPGCITGIEINEGKIMLIKWHIKVSFSGTLYVTREFIAGPKNLKDFFYSS